MSARPWLAMDENLILRAGAGTGKTHALVSMALGLLAGLRRGRPVPPHELWLLTFGEQAAAELRLRLRERIEALAAGAAVEEREPDLAAAARAIGARLPSQAVWRELAHRVDSVKATTLHGAGATLLRELGGRELSGFEILSADVADELLTAAAEETILHGPNPENLVLLLEDFGFRGVGGFAHGLVEALREVHKKRSEDGIDEVPWERAPAQDLAPVLARARTYVAEAGAGHNLPQALRAVAFLDVPVGPAGLAALEANWRGIERGRDAIGLKQKFNAKAAKDTLNELAGVLVTERAVGHTEVFCALLEEVRSRYESAKARRGALDFSDLCNRARNLLRDDPVARRAAKGKVGALLLDETQDTNRVQVELCLLLCEARGSEAKVDRLRPVASQIELERGVLLAVGDRKQSIYEFRGANVAVFEELAGAVERSHGQTVLLNTCRRSQPALLDFVNTFFAAALRDGGPEVPGFGDADRLLPHRSPLDLPRATLLALNKVKDERSEAARQREARAVAAKAASLLRVPPADLREAVGGEVRPGHLAFLFRRVKHIEYFRAALGEVGLAGVLVGGDGFWGCPEIFDAAALFAAVVDPDDGLAALTLLRSPLCGITDASLARLAFARPGKRLSLRALGQDLPRTLARDERERVAVFGEHLRALRSAARGLGAAGLLQAAERLFGLRSRYADPQVAANLDKLEGKLLAWQGAGRTLAATARRLQALTLDQPREPLAAAVDEMAQDAVRLMTIHAAKGLEFPVVFVVECGAPPRQDSYPALYARDIGLALKGREPGGQWARPPPYKRVEGIARTRSEAEELRLLYVAATRARDLLFFSGEAVHGDKGTWRRLLQEAGPAAGLEVETQPESPALASGPLFGAPAVAEPGQSIGHALEETAPLPRLVPERLPLAASAAADLGLCARRFQLRQLWQVPEQPGRRPEPEDLPLDDDPRALGSLAHRLLEVVDLSRAAEDLEAALQEASRRVDPAGVDTELLGEVRSILGSPLGQRMLGLPAARVRREVPFVLRLGSAPALVATGSIDLLLVLDDRVLVLDYKRGPPRQTASYEAQVRLYALAAHELTGGVLPVHAGLWFLRAGHEDPRTFEVWPDDLARFRAELVGAAREVAGLDARRQLFPGRELRYCRAIHCGYVARCHGGPAPG